MQPEPRVLIIEDHDALRVMLFTLLRYQPLGVDTAATVNDALEKVATCDYALILIDLSLPENGGETFLHRFHEQRPEATTFIIAVRDPNNEPLNEPGIVSAILNKPLEVDTLGEMIRECALVVPPPEDPLPCPTPAESDLRTMLDRGSYAQN